jgi:hypothetical protein
MTNSEVAPERETRPERGEMSHNRIIPLPSSLFRT